MDGEIKSYQQLSTEEMWANGLTKEEMAEGLRKLLKAGKCGIMKEEVKVVCENEEIKMLNIRNCKKKEEAIEGDKGNTKN